MLHITNSAKFFVWSIQCSWPTKIKLLRQRIGRWVSTEFPNGWLLTVQIHLTIFFSSRKVIRAWSCHRWKMKKFPLCIPTVWRSFKFLLAKNICEKLNVPNDCGWFILITSENKKLPNKKWFVVNSVYQSFIHKYGHLYKQLLDPFTYSIRWDCSFRIPLERIAKIISKWNIPRSWIPAESLDCSFWTVPHTMVCCLDSLVRFCPKCQGFCSFYRPKNTKWINLKLFTVERTAVAVLQHSKWIVLMAGEMETGAIWVIASWGFRQLEIS